MEIDIYGYSAIGTRHENQDNWSCGPLGTEGFYAFLADGCGGHVGGAQASQIALRTLLSCIEEASFPTYEDVEDWMAQANEDLLCIQKTSGEMKTTVVCLFVLKDQAIWGHVGDSRLYHFHNRILKHYTNDHSVSQLAVAAGKISRRDIRTHRDKNKLLRAMGDRSCVPEIQDVITLAPGQHEFLLCSDGLWERLIEEEIMLDLYKSSGAREWVTYLRKRAEKRQYGNVDNNTAIAVMLTVS